MEREIPNFTLRQGIPTSGELKEFTKDRTHRMIVLNDAMHSVVQDADVELLFTQGCHHRRVSVVFLTKNLFPRGAKSRTIALNTYYLVLMKNARDASQVTTLRRQMFPGEARVLTEAYLDATKEPYGYLVVDKSSHAVDRYRCARISFRERIRWSIKAYKRGYRSVVVFAMSRLLIEQHTSGTVLESWSIAEKNTDALGFAVKSSELNRPQRASG